MKLTQKNYYTEKNTHISNSKISDFMKGRKYFYRKHIAHEPEVQTVPSPAMKLGSIVDSLISGETPQYQVKVLKREDEHLFEKQKTMDPESFVTATQWEDALSHTVNLKNTPAYKWYKENDAKFQVILQGEYTTPVGDSIPLCGMADVITETKDAVYIDDFKVVAYEKISSGQKWIWNCQEMGYFRQLAFYKMLWQQMNPDDKRPVICRHLVSTKVKFTRGYFRAATFVVKDDILENALANQMQWMNRIAYCIKEDTWEDQPVTWDNALNLAYESRDQKSDKAN